MSKDELTEEDVMKYLEECNESQDIHGFCYIPAIVCSKILDLYQKEKEKNKELNEINFRVNKNLLEVTEELEQEKEKNKKLKKENEELDQKFKYAVPDEIVDELYISKDKIRKDLETCKKVYKEEMKPYQREYGLDVTYLTKKEKEKLINKRNCLIAQMETYKQLLEENNEMQ